MAAIQALPRYQDQGRPFLAFVYGIASHKVADAHRAAAATVPSPPRWFRNGSPWTRDPSRWPSMSDSAARMKKLLEVLPEKQREILTLRIVVGMSAEETAQAVGSTPGAVRVAQHRALARLKSEIAGSGYDYA